MTQYVPLGKPCYRIYHNDTKTWLVVDPEEIPFDIDKYIELNKSHGLSVEYFHVLMPKQPKTTKLKSLKGFGKVPLETRKKVRTKKRSAKR